MFTFPITYWSADATPEEAFITRWKTDNTGTTNNDQINFRVEQASNYHIDWGDGNDETFVGTGDLIHTYSAVGTYTVTVTGTAVFSMLNNGDSQKLVDILQYGNVTFNNNIRVLYNTSMTAISATDIPNLSNLTTMRDMFQATPSLTTIPNFDQWDVSNITDIINIFEGTNFNGVLPIFTSAITCIQSFFNNNSFNQNINDKFPSAIDASSMFRNAGSFNNAGVGITGFNTVTNATQMYANASALNVSINGFTSCTNANGFLNGATIFNSTVSGFNVVVNTGTMFANCPAYNQPVGFPVSQITNTNGMFQSATSYNQITNGYTNVTNASSMFFGASAFNNGGVAMTGYNSLTNTFGMFRTCVNFNVDTSALNVSAVTNCAFMYNSCVILNSPIPTSSFNAATNSNNMFNGCHAFNQPIGAGSFTNVTNAGGTFRVMLAFNQPLVNCFSSIVVATDMFNGTSLFDQDLSSWNVSALTSAANFLNGGSLSTANYDALLVAWDAQTLQSGVSIHFGTSTFTLLSAADTARTNMITNDLWTIIDGGGV